ncbi:iron-siderophore ABC transporter substrate-binding protein [Halanaerocella petrolearia]
MTYTTYGNKKIIMAISLMLITMMALVGCTSSQKTSQDNKKSNSKTRTVKHAMGTTKIKGTPKKVVVLTNGASDIALALGVKPVGAVEHWLGDPWYDYLEDDLKGVTVVGKETQPNLEKIASLNPDLIIGSKIRHEKIYNQLSAIAPTVFSETVGTVWKENTKLYAKALNKEEKGQELIDNWNQRVTTFKEKMGNRLDTTVSIVRFLPGQVRIYHKGFPGSIIKEVGLTRPKTQRKDTVIEKISKEQMPRLDADVLFYLTYDTGNGKGVSVEKEWLNDPLWQNLEVVKNDRAYKVNDVFWNTAGGIQSANKMLDDLYEIFLNE